MGTMLDYLEWRGDLPFSVVPFGEIDGLILSCFSYVRMEGIVPGPGEGQMTVRELADRFFRRHTRAELDADKSFTSFSPQILKRCAKSRRFENAVLQNFVNHVDESRELQFSAVEIIPEDGIPFVSFRGTDDTIIGWKEDFNISYEVIPADQEAVSYLNTIQSGKSGPLRIGGHSKGAHVAVYAASVCDEDIRDRVLAVYEMDGPGFNEEMIRNPYIAKMLPLVHRVNPTTSIIGTLLIHHKAPVIVQSSVSGVNEHNPTTWQVLGSSFQTAEEYSRTGKLFDETFNTWIASENMEQRRGFIDDMFSCLQASGCVTLSQMRKATGAQRKAMRERLMEIDPRTRTILQKLFLIFIGEVLDARSMINWAVRKK